MKRLRLIAPILLAFGLFTATTAAAQAPPDRTLVEVASSPFGAKLSGILDPVSAPDRASARDRSGTVVIDGREYGPRDGLRVDTWQIEIEPGAGPVGMVFDGVSSRPGLVTPMATWGSSYAISTETVQLYYSGKAKAAANVYNGRRIIQVCIWYTRGGVMKSAKVCSNATSAGTYWSPGSEVRTGAWGSLNPWAPPTIFNISTVRIDPRIY